MAGFPEIPEAAAESVIAALYDDIRSVTASPGVNLIYRHLATQPGALEWIWSVLRPLFLEQAIQTSAADILKPARDALETIKPDRDIPEAIRRPARAVLSFYLTNNPRNLLALEVTGRILMRSDAANGDRHETTIFSDGRIRGVGASKQGCSR